MFGFPVGGLSKANNGMQNSPILELNFAQTGALDSRITFTRNSNATYFNSSGTLTVSSANTPRFDYDPVTLAARGLLIEEQRTNTIRNSTMQGAVAGTPGTLPTNWSQSNNTGLAANVVGTGTENGINYIDLRINGTSTGTGQTNVFLDTATGIAALTAQVWSFSPYLKVQAGSLANITSINLVLQENTSGGVAVTAGSQAVSVPTTALSSYRPTYTRTLSGGGTVAALRPYIQFNINTGLAVDITLRIGLPQLEQGAFATSVIPTTSAQATRIADSATMTGTNFSSWYNASEGTLFAEAATYSAAINCGIASVNDGTANNRMQLFGETNAAVSWYATASGVNSMWISAGNRSANTVFKVAGAYATNNAAASLNGASAVTDASVTVPTVTQLSIAALHSGTSINGWIRRISYYPRRLTNAELQGITT